jgi:hypothetical protein
VAQSDENEQCRAARIICYDRGNLNSQTPARVPSPGQTMPPVRVPVAVTKQLQIHRPGNV